MTDLTSLISAAVAAKMTPEFIEKEVDVRVGKLLTESIDAALRSYSDVGKMIKAAVEEALKVDSINLPSYGSLVTTMLKAQIEARCSELIAGRLAEDMEQLLNLAPKEMKLSAIAEYMIQHRLSSDSWGPVITVIVEHTDYGFVHIYLDEDMVREERDKWRCEYHISLDKEGKIYSAKLRGHDLKDTTHISHSPYGLSQMIRAWVACGTTIIVDEDNVVTSVGDF